jgi:nucleoside-diphosphate-sugar epimerase
MKTAFVTGGTGFVGLNLVAQLKQEGWRVIAIHRRSSDTRYLKRQSPDELRECGLDDPAELARAMPESVDCVFHVAGAVSWWRGADRATERTNVDGTRHVVEAALMRKAKRFVQTSSVAAFGLQPAIDERTPSTAAKSPYAYVRTKWLGEEEVRKGIARGLDAVIMNPVNILGAWDTTSWAKMMILLKQKKLPGVPPGAGSWCHVREVVRAHVKAATVGRAGEQWLLGGTEGSYAEVVAIMAELLAVKPPRTLPAFMLKTVGRVSDLVSLVTKKEPDVSTGIAALLTSTWRADSSKAVRELGLVAVPLREMVVDAHRWLVDEHLV